MDGVFAYEYTPTARLLVTDEDAADFLQSQFSNELRPFSEGQCSYGLWLDVKGKVIADAWVLCEGEERFQVMSEHCPAELIAEKLEKHIIADDVEVEVLERPKACAIVGAGAAGLLDQVPEVGRFLRADGYVIFCGRRSAQPGYELIFDTDASAQAFHAKLQAAGVERVDRDRMQLERMEAGIPRIPSEIGPADLPGEGGYVNDGVSLTKGCYLGQEVVARMHNVGQARRALYIVQGEGSLPDCPLVLGNAAGKNVGELRSVVADGSGWQGVALLKIQHVALGERLPVENCVATIVRQLRV